MNLADLPPNRPADFGDAADEYAAATEWAAVFDVSDRVQIEATGADRASFLHNFCTNDVKGLSAGRGCEAFVTSVKGRVLGHVFVWVGAESLFLNASPETEPGLLEHLGRYAALENVELQGRTDELAELYVTGPECLERLSTLSEAAAGLDVLTHGAFEFPDDAGTVALRRSDWFNTPGASVVVPRERIAGVWKTLVDAGFSPAGNAAFETLRIEAGLPLYGVDVTDENLAQEVARTERAISFEKGCYLGQEPIARLDAMGHVNRELRNLRLETGPTPEPGSPVVSPEDEKEIGRITSAVASAKTNTPVALAYLRSKYVDAGTRLLVDAGGVRIPAVVFRAEHP